MSDFFYSQLDNLNGDILAAIIASGVAVSASDGSMEEGEVSELANSLAQLTNEQYSTEDIFSWISAGIDDVINNGPDAALGRAAEATEDPTLREVALLLASAIAWASKGVNAKEGVRLQQLARNLEIDQNRYFELLGEGKALVGLAWVSRAGTHQAAARAPRVAELGLKSVPGACELLVCYDQKPARAEHPQGAT